MLDAIETGAFQDEDIDYLEPIPRLPKWNVSVLASDPKTGCEVSSFKDYLIVFGENAAQDVLDTVADFTTTQIAGVPPSDALNVMVVRGRIRISSILPNGKTKSLYRIHEIDTGHGTVYARDTNASLPGHSSVDQVYEAILINDVVLSIRSITPKQLNRPRRQRPAMAECC